MPRSKECEVEIVFLLNCQGQPCETSFPSRETRGAQRVAKQLHNGLRAARHSSGGDALRGNTRTHPEHDG